IELIRRIQTEALNSGFETQAWFSTIVDLATRHDVDAILGRSIDRPILKKSKDKSFELRQEKLDTLKAELNVLLGDYTVARSRSYYRPYAEAFRLLREMIDRVMRRRGEIYIGEANK